MKYRKDKYNHVYYLQSTFHNKQATATILNYLSNPLKHTYSVFRTCVTRDNVNTKYLPGILINTIAIGTPKPYHI